jgi:hypothetical protein
MKNLLITILVSGSILGAQSAIRPPQMGFAGQADGTLRPVYGVAGNFILGPPAAGKVVSQAFSGSLGLLKTAATLEAFDAQGRVFANMDAAAGPALFAFSEDGVTALAYIASSNTLVELRGRRFTTVPFRQEPDTVVAIAMPNPFEAALIIDRNGSLWELRLQPGYARVTSQKALAGVTAPVLALSSGELVFSDANGIVLRKPDNSEVHIAGQSPAKFSLQQMGNNWVQLSDSESARRFAIRVSPAHDGLYQLPEVGQ